MLEIAFCGNVLRRRAQGAVSPCQCPAPTSWFTVRGLAFEAQKSWRLHGPQGGILFSSPFCPCVQLSQPLTKTSASLKPGETVRDLVACWMTSPRGSEDFNAWRLALFSLWLLSDSVLPQDVGAEKL